MTRRDDHEAARPASEPWLSYRPLSAGMPKKAGFTLIELLVVVAIIALLISILLPSLSKAREQARATLCASRLGQLSKAMLIYADDYAEALPFILKGPGSTQEYHDDPTVPENRRKEVWLADGSTMERIYDLSEGEWYTENHPRVPQSGTLFPYARFENLYKCPEFERVKDPLKRHSVFNYTRSILGRKAVATSDPLNDRDIAYFLGIVKLSGPYNAASLPLMLDESWYSYVAYGFVAGWVWGGHDPVMDLFNSCLGSYHGTEKRGWGWRPESGSGEYIEDVYPDEPYKLASVSYYDGHVGLERDPVPNLDIGSTAGRPQTFLGLLGPLFPYDEAYGHWVENMLYAQQGITLEQWLDRGMDPPNPD